LKLFLQYISQ